MYISFVYIYSVTNILLIIRGTYVIYCRVQYIKYEFRDN